MFFYGFILVQFGVIDFIIKGLVFDWNLLFGFVYFVFIFFQEIVIFFILIVVGWVFYRCYIEKFVRLKCGFKVGFVFIFIGGLMLIVLVGNGMNLIWYEYGFLWSELIVLGIVFLFSGVGEIGVVVIFYIVWWVYFLFLLSFLVYVFQLKYVYLIVGLVNVFFNRMELVGKFEKIDFIDEMKESYGVGKIEDFWQFQLFDLYVCVECGCCINMCFVIGIGKMLLLMDLILCFRDYFIEKGVVVILCLLWVFVVVFWYIRGNQLVVLLVGSGLQEVVVVLDYNLSLIGDVIIEEEIWVCIICWNCED